MRASRSHFIEQFYPAFIVRVLGAWKLRAKTSHEVIAIYIHQAITDSNGKVPIPKAEFFQIVEPMILELIASTPNGTKPECKEFAGLIYDVLDAAGVDIEIGPPTRSHGHMFGANR